MFLRCLPIVAMSLFAPIVPAIAGPLDDDALQSKVTPATFVTDLGSANRIQAADRLRTLSQETSAATCFLQHGIQPDHNHAVLTNNLAEFDQILDALLWGDPERNIIGQESHPKTMHKLYDMAGEWHDLRSVVSEFVANPYDKEAAAAVLAQSGPMLTKTTRLLLEIQTDNSHPVNVLMEDILLLEFSGRNAMLAQKIALEACMLWSNGSNTALKDQFDQSTAEFNLIATALLKGLPEVDVAAAPTAEINDALIDVLADWEQEMFFLNRIASGADVSRDEVEWVNQALNLKTAKMEAILAMYADYSRRAIP